MFWLFLRRTSLFNFKMFYKLYKPVSSNADYIDIPIFFIVGHINKNDTKRVLQWCILARRQLVKQSITAFDVLDDSLWGGKLLVMYLTTACEAV